MRCDAMCKAPMGSKFQWIEVTQRNSKSIMTLLVTNSFRPPTSLRHSIRARNLLNLEVRSPTAIRVSGDVDYRANMKRSRNENLVK